MSRRSARRSSRASTPKIQGRSGGGAGKPSGAQRSGSGVPTSVPALRYRVHWIRVGSPTVPSVAAPSGADVLRDDEAIAEIDGIARAQVTVAPLPRAVGEIGAQTRQPGLRVGELAERRDRAAHTGVEIRLRPPPVRAEKPVDAVMGHEDRPHLDAAECPPELLERREDVAIERHQLRKVIVDQPEPEHRGRVPREDHHALARDARQLAEPARAIGPVVHGEHGEGGAERRVAERQIAGGAVPGRRWRSIAADGSTATTGRSAGSYEPAPAPTFTTLAAAPSASAMAAAIRGSGRRWAS